MATVSDRTIVDGIIAGNGAYEGHPRVMRIVEFENEGAPEWGLVFETDGDPNRYEGKSGYRILWTPAATEYRFPLADYLDSRTK